MTLLRHLSLCLFVSGAFLGCAATTPVSDAGLDAGSDAGRDAGTYADACAAVSGATFESVELLEGGNCVPVDGGMCAKMHWRLTFTAPAKFSWEYTDVVQAGTYTCSGATLTPTPGTAATYNSANDQLLWAGKAYERK